MKKDLLYLYTSKISTATWGVKIFRIIPEFRILMLKVSLKMLNLADFNSFSDLFSVHFRTSDH